MYRSWRRAYFAARSGFNRRRFVAAAPGTRDGRPLVPAHAHFDHHSPSAHDTFSVPRVHEDDVVVLPGHGEPWTAGAERMVEAARAAGSA